MPPRSIRGIVADIEHAAMRVHRGVIGSGTLALYGLAMAAYLEFVEGMHRDARVIAALSAAGLVLAVLVLRGWRSAAVALVATYAAGAAWVLVRMPFSPFMFYPLLAGGIAVAGGLYTFQLPRLYREFVERWTPHEVQPGDLYTVRDGDGFAVMKVLAREPGRVHVRQFGLRYADRPWTVKSSTLERDPVTNGGRRFPHLPLDEAEFARGEPVFVRREPLAADELLAMSDWQRMHERPGASSP